MTALTDLHRSTRCLTDLARPVGAAPIQTELTRPRPHDLNKLQTEPTKLDPLTRIHIWQDLETVQRLKCGTELCRGISATLWYGTVWSEGSQNRYGAVQYGTD